jgi:hypothetical protein
MFLEHTASAEQNFHTKPCTNARLNRKIVSLMGSKYSQKSSISFWKVTWNYVLPFLWQNMLWINVPRPKTNLYVMSTIDPTKKGNK